MCHDKNTARIAYSNASYLQNVPVSSIPVMSLKNWVIVVSLLQPIF